jgi:hypothetical protein
VSTELPTGDTAETGHAVQSENAVLNVNGWYVSSGQNEQRALSWDSLYLPVVHATHVTPSVPVYPRSHLQAAAAELPVEIVRDGPVVVSEHNVQVASVFPVLVEYLSTGQSVHGADPSVVLYFPAGHVVHSLPSFPVYPARHVQFIRASLPPGDRDPAGHATQVLAVAPTYIE